MYTFYVLYIMLFLNLFVKLDTAKTDVSHGVFSSISVSSLDVADEIKAKYPNVKTVYYNKGL